MSVTSFVHTASLLTFLFFFFFNDTATTEIYTLSLHDALPISDPARPRAVPEAVAGGAGLPPAARGGLDRKSTRLNSSHANISYAVFCLKKKKRRRIRASTTRDRQRRAPMSCSVIKFRLRRARV